MLITICLSIKFWEQMLEVQKQLEQMGHEVLTPPNKLLDDKGNSISVQKYYEIRKSDLPDDWVWERKRQAIQAHFEKVARADAVLILNYEKNGQPNYIGGNTFLEMGLAFWLKKPIYLLNPIPEELGYAEEIKGMKPIILNGLLDKIKQV